MAWKHQKGKEALDSIDELPGTIQINTNNGSTQMIIKMIEAWEVERMLCVRCGLNGEDDTKLKYRVKQVIGLVGRIKQATLTRFDADIVFRERWMTMIKYCLTITRFNKQRCHQITNIVEQDILPKLGVNRQMTKLVLNGTKKYGWKQLMNTTNNLILRKIMAHIQSADNIGTLQRILLNK